MTNTRIDYNMEGTPDETGRPRFHNPKDWDREKTIAETIRKSFHLDEMASIGDQSYIDFIAIRNGQALAGIEIKSRTQNHKTLMDWGGIFLSHTKIHNATQLAKTPLSTNWAGVYIFFDLKDGLYYREVRELKGKTTLMKSRRQRIASDTETGINITNLHLWALWTPNHSPKE